MPLLSVVIVTYNSVPFIRMCLDSLLYYHDDRLEVIIVDNNSTDGTTKLIEQYYPEVRIIHNTKNVGFGKACNQGMADSNGRYFLMLNPDTIVPENICDLVLDFMREHPDCGAMGVKMIDGNGKFLPESKRGLPTLLRSAYRMMGLSALFPRSKTFARYYLGHLSPEEVNEIEILAGAFMVFDAEVIKKYGGFDERFFMYGEDIDLSWRIKSAGYKVFYNPQITIVHFKGESTIRNAAYVKIFYEAMDIFYDIHFRSGKDRFFRKVVRFFTWLFAKITALLLNVKKLFVVEKSVFPLNGNYLNLVSSESSLTAIPNKVINGLSLGTIYLNDAILKYPDSFLIIDSSKVKPSEAIVYINKVNDKFKGFLWLPTDKSLILFPISATRNTQMLSLK